MQLPNLFFRQYGFTGDRLVVDTVLVMVMVMEVYLMRRKGKDSWASMLIFQDESAYKESTTMTILIGG